MKLNKEQIVEYIKEKKNLFIPLAGLLLVIVFSSIFSKNSDEEKKGISWKIGNKDVTSDSINVGKVNKSTLDQEENHNNEQSNFTTPVNRNKKDELDYLDELDNQDIKTANSAQKKEPSSYSPYGDYSMWEKKEPRNSKIGYSNLQSQKRQIDESTSQSMKNTNQGQYYQDEKIVKPIAYCEAESISAGHFSNNRTWIFLITESFSIGNQKFEANNSYAIGIIKMVGDRALCNIHTVKTGQIQIKVNAKIVGVDGVDGYPLPVNYDSEETVGDVIEGEASNQVNRIPVVGGVVSSIARATKRKKRKKIPITSDMQVEIQIFGTKER